MTALRGMLGSGIWAFGALMMVNVGGFAFHMIAGRALHVGDYGTLYSLISLYTLATMPQSLVSPVIARFAAEFRALHDNGHLRGLLSAMGRIFGIASLVYIAVSIAFAAPIGSFLHIPAWQIPIVGIVSAIGGASVGYRSFSTGSHRFKLYAVSCSAEGVAKVALLAAAALTGLTLEKSILSFSGAVLLGFAAMLLPLLNSYRSVAKVDVRIDLRRLLATTMGAAAAAFTTIAMGYADVLLVKHYFNDHDAGLYSAASLSAKILLFFIGFVPGVLIPHATDRHARGQRTRDTLFLAMGFVVVASVIGVLFYRFEGTFLLRLLVGPQFSAAAPLLTGYGAAMAILSCTNALVSYGIATHRLGFSLPVVLGTLATMVWIALAHVTLGNVVFELIVGNVIVCAAAGIALIAQWKKPVAA